MRRNTDWDDDGIDPLKGPNQPTDFLKVNFSLMAVGGSFRTVKAKFPPKTIHAAAAKAGWIVQIDDLAPWVKVTIVGKLPPKTAAPAKPAFYKGAGKVYPASETKPATRRTSGGARATSANPVPRSQPGFKGWRRFQKKAPSSAPPSKPDIFS